MTWNPSTALRRASVVTALLLLSAPGTSVLAQDRAERIEDFLSSYHELRQFNGSVLVAENGRVIYKGGFGDANMEWDVPNTSDTRFRIGSVTKQFTAAIVLQLVEEGRVDLDGTIVGYIPDYPQPQGNRVTIHQLLNHTSGIPSYTGLPDFFEELSRDPYSPEELVAVVSGMELEFEPGSTFRYNNSGYFILGLIIENVTGQSYDVVLGERILDPLGMENTGYDHYSEVRERGASGYSKTLTGYQDAAYLDTSLPYAAGMMYSTVEDLFKWDRALYAGTMFTDPGTMELMTSPGLSDYGYGLVIHDVAIGEGELKVRVIEHGGGINGFATMFRRFPDDGHLIAIADNTEGNLGRIVTGLTDILYGQPVGEPAASIAEELMAVIDSRDVEAAVARYKQVKEADPDAYNFAERELNLLGYHYLGQGDTGTALEIFKLNTAAYPEAWNAFDSLGEAYMEAGNKDLAIANYQRSLELNPANENGKEMLAKLGVEVEDAEDLQLPVEILQRYVGKYEIREGFIITVTLEDGQLMAQATGQRVFPIFAQSETRFYLKVVAAQMEFQVNSDGTVDTLTLYQGGNEIVGTRID